MTSTKCPAVTGPSEGGKSGIRLWFTGSHKLIYSSPPPPYLWFPFCSFNYLLSAQSENAKWKILEIRSSKVLNYTLF